jgi:hypothetical protein
MAAGKARSGRSRSDEEIVEARKRELWSNPSRILPLGVSARLSLSACRELRNAAWSATALVQLRLILPHEPRPTWALLAGTRNYSVDLVLFLL